MQAQELRAEEQREIDKLMVGKPLKQPVEKKSVNPTLYDLETELVKGAEVEVIKQRDFFQLRYADEYKKRRRTRVVAIIFGIFGCAFASVIMYLYFTGVILFNF